MAGLTEDQLVTLRRHLHAHPELSLAEHETVAYLKARISEFPQTYLSYRTVPAVPTAFLVRVAGYDPQRTLGYRTDMDALPIQEATGLPFSSVNDGVMHACGHDIHMTVAMGLLSHFASEQPKDNLVFLFQPAEEMYSGGQQVYDAGVFVDDFAVDEFYGLHDNPDLPAGMIATSLGTLFAGTTEVQVTFTGSGGHAAYPHRANDAVITASAFVLQLQTAVSRRIDPIESGVITLGSLHAGNAGNIIAETAEITGTIRALKQPILVALQQQVRQIAAGVAATYGVEANVVLTQGGYLPVANDPDLTANFIAYMRHQTAVPFKIVPPAMTGEDFGYLIHQIPGVMFWLGVASQYPLHSSHLSPDEAALTTGIPAIRDFLCYRMMSDALNG